jgi:hypothetical protein
VQKYSINSFADLLKYLSGKRNWGEQERTHYNVRRGNATKKEEFKDAVAKIIKSGEYNENVMFFSKSGN